MNHLALSLTCWTITLLDATVAYVENQREAQNYLEGRAPYEDEVATNRHWASR